MKFLCLAYYDEKAFTEISPDAFQSIVSQCPAYDQKLRDTGKLVFSASLGPSSETTTLKPKNGKPKVIDGPFTEAKELVGGFFVIEARDIGEATDVASNHPAAHLGEQIGWAVEIRPIDFFEQPGA
ncbi:MAG: YciI family protein [Pseudomonadota bacterium]